MLIKKKACREREAGEQVGGGGGGTHLLRIPIRVCAAQRCRGFRGPVLQQVFLYSSRPCT